MEGMWSPVSDTPSRPVALVFGAHITGLAVLRAFGRAGVPAFAVGVDRTMTRRSRWFRPIEGGDRLREDADSADVAAWLEALPFSRAVLFPCSDRWALTVASLPESVTARFIPAVAPERVLRTLVDKQLFAEAAAIAGVPAPRVLEPRQLDEVGPEDVPRFFIKPRDSQAFARRFGVKALRIRHYEDARHLIGRMAAEEIDVVLQEMIPGGPTAHVFLDGYVDRAGMMRACLARRRLRMHPRPFGNSTLSVTIPRLEVQAAIDALGALFRAIGYRGGLFDAEFSFDERDGLFKVIEINARPWWQLQLTQSAGLDVCMMAFQDALGEPVPTARGYRLGMTWVHPLPDLSAWWADRHRADRAGAFPLRTWFTGPNAVFSWDDPKPAIDEVARSVKLATGRMPHFGKPNAKNQTPQGELVPVPRGGAKPPGLARSSRTNGRRSRPGPAG